MKLRGLLGLLPLLVLIGGVDPAVADTGKAAAGVAPLPVVLVPATTGPTPPPSTSHGSSPNNPRILTRVPVAGK